MPRTIYGNESIDITVAGSGPSYTFSDPLAVDVDNHVQLKTDAASLAVDPGTGVIKVADTLLAGKQSTDANLTGLSGANPTLTTPLSVQGTLTAGGTTGSLFSLKGKERWGSTVDTANGVNVSLGINRSGNRQMVVSASDYDTAANYGIRMSVGSGNPYIGAVKLDGTANGPLVLGSTYLDLNNGAQAGPAFSTPNGGAKVVLASTGTASAVTYGSGVEAYHLWWSLPVANDPLFGFKWYGGTTQLARLEGTGSLTLTNNSTAATTVLSRQLQAGLPGTGGLNLMYVGRAETSNECGYLGFRSVGTNSRFNTLELCVGGQPASLALSLDGYGALTLPNDVWHKTADAIPRLFFAANGTNYYQSGAPGHTWRKNAGIDLMSLDTNAKLSLINSSTTNFSDLLTLFQAGLPTGGQNYIQFGQASSAKNGAVLSFLYNATGSATNQIQLGFGGMAPSLTLVADGSTTVSGALTMANNIYHKSADGVARMYFQTNGGNMWRSALDHVWCINNNTTTAMGLDTNGMLTVSNVATATTTACRILQPGLPAVGVTYMTVGRNNAANNDAAVMAFKSVGVGSASNTLELSLAGSANSVKVDAAGNLTVPGNITATGSITASGSGVTKFSQSHCVTSNFSINVGSWNYWPISALTQQFLAGTSVAESSVIAGKLSYVIPVNGIYLMTMSLMRNDSNQVSASGVAVFPNASTTSQTYWQLDAPQNYYTWSYQMYFNANQRVAPVLYGNPGGAGSILASGQRGTPSAVNEFAITLLTPL